MSQAEAVGGLDVVGQGFKCLWVGQKSLSRTGEMEEADLFDQVRSLCTVFPT